MKKSQVKEAIRLTQECWYHYWQLDVEYLLGYCDENVSWIGAEQSEFIQGFENVKRNFVELLNHLRPCYLLNQEFFIAQNSGKTCTVIGKYLVTTDDENDYFLQVQQRCTFVWELKDDKLRIMHIHVSNPMGELKVAEGERFVNSLGYMANKYMQKRIEDKLSDRQIIITDEKRTMRLLRISDILYIAANHNNVIITTLNEVINATICMTEFMGMTKDAFLKIHRSYAINLNYMSKLERYCVTMTNGEQIPIPVKKYNYIKEKMMQIYREE